MTRLLFTASAALSLLACDRGEAQSQPARARAAVPARPAAGFDTFWTRFRAAALAGDAAQLQALSRPVVLAHGELDDDPVRRLPAARVPGAVAAAMAAPDPDGMAGRVIRDSIRAHVRFAPGELDGVGQQRVGPFVFKPGTGGWRLAEIYAGS